MIGSSQYQTPQRPHTRRPSVCLRHFFTGKREQRSTKETERTSAERAAGKWEAELREGRYKRKSKITWQEFREAFLDSLDDSPEKTVTSYVSAFNALTKHLAI
jgi:hypothetical protein